MDWARIEKDVWYVWRGLGMWRAAIATGILGVAFWGWEHYRWEWLSGGAPGWLANYFLVIPGWAMALMVGSTLAAISLVRHLVKLERRREPRVEINWRLNEHRIAELVLLNTSIGTIDDMNVQISNVRDANGHHVRDVMTDLVSTDGRSYPISLHPNAPMYFPFAKISGAMERTRHIALISNYEPVLSIDEAECGVKLRVSGRNVVAAPIILRLKRKDNENLSVEAWQAGIPAVGLEE